MAEYEDEHRIFLQGMLSRGILNTAQVNKLMETALLSCKIAMPESKRDRQVLLFQLVQKINDQLRPLNLIIKKGIDEEDGTNYFMLVSDCKRSEGFGQVQTKMSQGELEFIRLVATEMLNVEDRCLSSREALSLLQEMKGVKFSMVDADKALTNLENDRWLKKLSNGKLTLGVRFINEMEDWISAVKGGEVDKCKTCQKFALRGFRCKCGLLFHRHCGQKLAKADKVGDKFKCIGCQSHVYLVTNARSEDDESGAERRNSRRKRGSQVIESSDED